MAIDLIFKEPNTGAAAGELWRDRLDRARNFRKHHRNGEEAWRRYIDLYGGEHWSESHQDPWGPKSDHARNRITVNITGSTILNIMPFLLRKNPRYRVLPRTPFDVNGAKIQDSLLNYVWRAFSMQKQLRKSVLDSIIIGHGIIKSGFQLEVVDSIPEQPIAGGTLDYRDYIRSEEPWIRRVNPFLFFWDTEASEYDLESARWCIEVFFKSAADIVENTTYSKTVRNAIKSGKESPTTVRSYGSLLEDEEQRFVSRNDSEDPENSRIVCFEVWDKRTGKYYVYAHGVDRPLREEAEWPFSYLDGFPYDRLDFIPVVNDHYPLGLPKFVEDQQLELNRVRTAIFEHRRRFNRKYAALRDRVDPAELDKLAAGADGTIVIEDVPNAIRAIEDANMSSDQLAVEQRIKDDFRELTGADELLRGGQLPSRTTATEIQSRASLIGLKIEDRVESVDAFVTNIGRKLIAHMKENYVTEKVIRVTGPRGVEWVEFSPDEIRGEYDVEVESVSADRNDPTTERQQRIQVFTLMMNSLPLLLQAKVPIDIGKALKWVLETFNQSKEIGLFFPESLVIDQPLQEQFGGAPGTGSLPHEPGQPAGPGAQGAQAGAAEGPGQVNAGILGQLLGQMSGGGVG